MRIALKDLLHQQWQAIVGEPATIWSESKSYLSDERLHRKENGDATPSRSGQGHSRFFRVHATSGYPPKLTVKANEADRQPWPSRPGEFHPEPLTDPDLNLSIHPARVTARRLPPSAEPSGSSRFDPVGPRSTTMTHPLRSMGIAPLRRYYEAVRPSPAHRYFQPHGWSRLCFFPWHRRPGSHVPYKSLVELRAASMPDAAWAVSVHPPS
jgi:hypothetical protein